MDGIDRRRLALEALGVKGDGVPRHKKSFRTVSSIKVRLDKLKMSGRKPYRQCYRKVRYPNRSAATLVARRCQQKRGGEIRVYFCGICNGWHLTSHVHNHEKPV